MSAAGVASQLLEVLIAIAAAPLLAGWVTQCRAWLANRSGPGLLQPYRQLRKLFMKDAIVAHGASPLFRFVPYLQFAAMALATRWATAPLLLILCAATLVLAWPRRADLRWADACLGVALFAATVAGLLLYNAARFGDPLETGYGLWYAHQGRPMFQADGYLRHAAEARDRRP